MSQKELIVNYLKSGKTLTALKALELFNCMSLGERVSELRSRGMQIQSKMIKTPSGKTIAEYSLDQFKTELF